MGWRCSLATVTDGRSYGRPGRRMQERSKNFGRWLHGLVNPPCLEHLGDEITDKTAGHRSERSADARKEW